MLCVKGNMVHMR